MRKLISILLLVLASVAAGAQSSTSISASSITDSFGHPIASAKLCFAPVDATGTATGFRVGSVQVITTPVCGLVSNGVLQTGLSLVPTPAGAYYKISVNNRTSNASLRDYGMTQVTGSSWSLDSYDPSMAVLPVSAITVGTITTLPSGTGASCTITGTSPYRLNCGIPRGADGSGSIAGLVSDGSNGIGVQGKVGTPNVNGSVYASQYATGGNGTPSTPWTSASGTGGIQEAVNAVGTTGGNPASRTVWINPGYYSITASIVIPSGINLLGTGWDSVLYVSASLSSTTDVILVQPTVSAQVKGFRLEDFNILPASGTPGRCGIRLDGTNNEIQQGLISHVSIHQLGSNAVCAIGSGAAQGTPVLTTIRDSILTGGFSCTACGDSLSLIHNQLNGAGINEFDFQPGATGLVLDSNNVTNDGGTHFGGTSVIYAPKILNNEFEPQSTFTGSNASVLDLDGPTGGNIINGGVVSGNSCSTSSSTIAANCIRLNNARNVKVHDNDFTRGAVAGSLDILETANSVNNKIGVNFWNSGGPLTGVAGTTSGMLSDLGSHNFLNFIDYLSGSSATGPALQNNHPMLYIDQNGSTFPAMMMDGTGTIHIYGSVNGPMFESTSGTQFVRNGTNGQYVMTWSSAASTTPGSSTVATAYNVGLANGHVLFSTGAPAIASGFGTSPSISGVAAYFKVTVGTGGTAATGVLTMPTLPTAATEWDAGCDDLTTFTATVFRTRVTARSATSVTLGNFDNTATSQPWTAGDVLLCHAWAK